MVEAAVLIFSGLLILLTLLPFSKSSFWWVRVWEFPRLQLGFLLLLALALQGLLFTYDKRWDLAVSAVTIIAILYQIWWILPYNSIWRDEVKWADNDPTKPRVSVMAANVLTPNRNAAGLREIILKWSPDVVVTVETDKWWEAELDQLNDFYPHAIRCPLDNLYGMHVYSKFPLEDGEIQYLVEDDVPSIHASLRVHEQLKIRMHFLHPAPPSPTENDESSERDAELIMVAKSLQDEDGPTIVTGDLNDVAWSPTTRLLRKISGLLDPRVGRGMINTFHADYWFLRWPLDHIFHSAHFRLVRIERLPHFGSDHFPVFIELQYAAEHDLQQAGLESDHTDEQEAREKMNEEEVHENNTPEPEAKG